MQSILATWQSYIQVEVQTRFKHGCQNIASLTGLSFWLIIPCISRLEDLSVLSKKQLNERRVLRLILERPWTLRHLVVLTTPQVP